jgi:peptidoglycan biosynthesis protein MviN/MurJ (putative lipid II flippase)
VARPAIELFLGGGSFDEQDVATTSLILGVFALAVPLESATHLLSRAIYATRNTVLVVAASIVGLIVTVAAVNALVDSQGVVALPLAFAAGQLAKVAVLVGALVIRIRVVGAEADPPAASG